MGNFTQDNVLTRGQGFSYGLLDTLNKHFQNTLHINRARSSGLQAAYFGYMIDFKPLSKITYTASAHTLLPHLAMRTGSFDIMATNPYSSGGSVYMVLERSSPGLVFCIDLLEGSVLRFSLLVMV